MNLLALRTALGLSQADMGKILGCGQANYSRYETGPREMPLKYLVQLSILYHVSVDYLLGLDAAGRLPVKTLEPERFMEDWISEKPYCGRIRTLRKELGITQTQAAQKIGYSQQSYSAYEKGSKAVTIKVLVKLARFYQVSTDYILGLTDER